MEKRTTRRKSGTRRKALREYQVKMIRFTISEATSRRDPKQGNLLNDPASVKSLLEGIHDQLEPGQEHVLVVCLDSRKRLIGWREAYRGTLDRATVEPREFFRTALAVGAASIIASHNHPSGDVAASTEDVQFTKHLVQAGEVMGIRVLDHIIVGGVGRSLSMYEAGLLSAGAELAPKSSAPTPRRAARRQRLASTGHDRNVLPGPWHPERGSEG